ncbi:GIY-YIG nuclease family protein [Minwuia sp.]|uniref:GIY-YIG nuclease family protein n=1 Tax=Minwuia sp. TaxID=2493630 RepID=UPI003A8DCAC0
MPKTYFVYLMTDRKSGRFYCGVTSDLIRRCAQHRAGTADSYTRQHGLQYLVWYETHENIRDALRREKRVKRWNRDYKFNAIGAVNPDWRDLSGSLGGAPIETCPLIPRAG